MRLLKLSLCISLFLANTIFAQTKEISLEEIWNNTFKTKRLEVLNSMNNGKQYSVLNYSKTDGSTTIDVYDYETLSKVKTFVNSANLSELPFFTDYSFSNDETQVLLATNEEKIYRHSSVGNYYVYNSSTNQVTLVSENKIQEPTFSPKGKKIAYSYNNNLFIKDLLSGEVEQITFDGEKNKIINGITDWVYEEEFSFVRAYEWNADGDKIAYIKFDETEVPEFSMDIYGTGLYQTQQVFKYPKAGEKNSVVSLHVYNIQSKSTNEIIVDNTIQDFYISRIKWTNDPDVLSAQYLNRHQNKLDIWLANTKTLESTLVLEEIESEYVSRTFSLTFLKDNSFIWISEKDGFNHIYHYSKNGDLINQITKGNWEVTKYYGFNEKLGKIFYQSVENGSINRDVYAIDLNGRNKKRLTKREGTNQAYFSADFSYFINSYSSAKIPHEYTLNITSSGELIKKIKDNQKLIEQLSNYKFSFKEFSTIYINGNDLNMWMIKPVDFDESKQYPLLMCQYSGPGSQRVTNSWYRPERYYWFQMLAQQGYIIVCVDGRGTGYKGEAFKKSTYLNLVKYETEDQIAVAKKLGELPYIDKERIGIWGWSYGGHMSTNCILKGNDIFKMAIAVAPVTSWRFYDTIYTERFMRTPQENPEGYDDNSPFNYPELLKGDYLLIHGSGDDNVHLQHTMRMVEALVQANKQFEWAIYPDKTHGIRGGNTSLHLYRKMTDFIYKTLGDKLDIKSTPEKEVKIKE